MRWIFLLLAFAWVALALAVAFGYHIAQPVGELSVSIDGHTYYGNPPAITLYEKDPVSVIITMSVLGTCLAASFVELVVRTKKRWTRPGSVAIVTGGLTVLFSLFGLLYGLVSIGVVGALVLLSGLPTKTSSDM
jgi:O-antigen/teichoic acid export membrane protein